MTDYFPSNIDFWWTLLTGLLGGTIAFLLSRTAEERGVALVSHQVAASQAPRQIVTSQVRQIEFALRELCSSTQGTIQSDDVQRILEPIIKENLQLRGKLESYDAKLQEQAEQLKSYMAQAQTDGLTGLANRRYFDDLLHRRVCERQRRRMPHALLLIDIDHFKKFNDDFGHLAGDMVLKGVGRILTKIMRESDVVARYGGEEFAIILSDSDLENAIGVAERIRTQIEQSYFRINEVILHVTASVGITELHTGETVSDVVQHADAALYDAKAAGRNQTHYYNQGSTQRVATFAAYGKDDPVSPSV